MAKRLKKQKIGSFAVDSGTVVICDPCNAKSASDFSDRAEFVEEMFEREGATGTTEQLFPNGVPAAVFSTTGIGDGIYPVFAHRDEEGTIVRITIEFDI